MGQGEHLAALFRLGEIPQPDAQVPQGHDYHAGPVLARAPRHAAHALPAVPDGVGAEEGLDLRVVTGLDDGYDLPRIIAIELRGGTDGRARAAVDARVIPFLEAVVLLQFLEKMVHGYIGLMTLARRAQRPGKKRLIYTMISSLLPTSTSRRPLVMAFTMMRAAFSTVMPPA